jgi:hypothetical protein
MRLIELACPEFGEVYCVGTEANSGHDFLIEANCRRSSLELLVFLDSRGVCGQYRGSLAERILLHVQDRRRFLAVCRPLQLTTWATLCNFLIANGLRPRHIVTNVGFVDFTPKKLSILEDARMQVEAYMGSGVATPIFIENYDNAKGETMPLYSLSYAEAYRSGVQNALQGLTCTVINSPMVSAEIEIPKKRPKSFFTGLRDGNAFNRSLPGVHIVDPPDFDETRTYDGVHYTHLGNEIIFAAVEPYL